MRKVMLLVLLSLLLAPMTLSQADGGYDEQEVVFKIERNICTVLRVISHALGVPANRIQDCRAVGHSADLPHEWIWGWRPGRHSDRYKSHYTVTNIYYVDGASTVLSVQTSEPQVVEGEGWSNIYEAGLTPIDQEVTVTMELQEQKSSSYDVGVSFSITNRTSVKVSGGVPGGEAEASTETEISASSSFGLNESSEKSTTETYSETTTLHIPAHSKIKVTADKVRYTELRTVQENAYLDFEFEVKLYHFACSHSVRYLCDGESYEPLHFDNIRDFCDFIEGKHPREHPRMEHFLRDAKDGRTGWAGHVVREYDWLCHQKEHRLVQLTRVDKRSYDNVTQIRTESLDAYERVEEAA